MPNAWDVGSARILESLGFVAIATTSSGFASSLGRMDQQVTLEELADHVRSLTSTLRVPLSVDAENCYSETEDGVQTCVELLAGAGAAGLSIEDYSPLTGIYPYELALSRVASAAACAHRHGLVLTARAENHLYEVDDIEDTMRRLRAFVEAGADVAYAPGLDDIEVITRVVDEVRLPLNVLLLPSGPSVTQLAEVGVRRVSVGGALAFTAYGALAAGARELLDSGSMGFTNQRLSFEDRLRAFSKPGS